MHYGNELNNITIVKIWFQAPSQLGIFAKSNKRKHGEIHYCTKEAGNLEHDLVFVAVDGLDNTVQTVLEIVLEQPTQKIFFVWVVMHHVFLRC